MTSLLVLCTGKYYCNQMVKGFLKSFNSALESPRVRDEISTACDEIQYEYLVG